MRKVLIGVTMFFAVVIGVGLASEPDRAPTRPVTASGDAAYSHELLQRDADMTQRMSTPRADGPMQRGALRDPQLDHSQVPGFVDALVQHQEAIDRMLARPGE